MTIRTEEQAAQAGYLRSAFKALLENKAWQEEFAPKLKAAFDEHREGCRARAKTPEERAQHVEASYLAEDLMGFCERRIAELEKELDAYSAKNSS